MPELRIGRVGSRFVVTWKDLGTGERRRFRLKARDADAANAEAIAVYRRENTPSGGLKIKHHWEDYIAHLGSKPTAETMRHTGKAVLAYFGELTEDEITIEHSSRVCGEALCGRKEAGNGAYRDRAPALVPEMVRQDRPDQSSAPS
ncbi:MAG: hypothetical protein AAGC86_06995 [Pseudomonadota bacterium]